MIHNRISSSAEVRGPVFGLERTEPTRLPIPFAPELINHQSEEENLDFENFLEDVHQ